VIGDKYTICDPYLFTIASQVKGKHPAKAVMGKSSGGSGGDLA
jgi:hypothetical protein